MGADEPLVMIQICWRFDRADPSGVKAPGLPTYMTNLGVSVWDPCVLRGAGESPSFISDFGGAGGIADVAIVSWTIPGENLQRVLYVGSWNVLRFSEDHRLLHLTDELSRLRVDMVRLSERRPGRGETSTKCFTYYWSSHGK